MSAPIVPPLRLSSVQHLRSFTPDKEPKAIVDAIRSHQPQLAKFLLAPYRTPSPTYKAIADTVISEALQIAGLEDPTILLSMLQWVNPEQFKLTLAGIAISAAERGYFSLDTNENEKVAVKIIPRLDSAIVRMLLWDSRHPDFTEMISSYHPDIQAGIDSDWNEVARNATKIMANVVDTQEELMIWAAGMGSISIVAWLINNQVDIPDEAILAATYQDRTEIVQFLEAHQKWIRR